jgi:excisionase family DNA binding protein
MDHNIHQILITRQHAAEILAVSLRTVDNLLAAGKLESINIGTARRIPYTAVQAFAATGTK